MVILAFTGPELPNIDVCLTKMDKHVYEIPGMLIPETGFTVVGQIHSEVKYT